MRTIARRIADIAFGTLDRAAYLFDAPYYDDSGMLYCQMQWEDEYLSW